MKLVSLIGLVAAVCTTSAFIPQVLKTLITKDTKGISLLMYSIFSLGVLLWLIYGIIIGDIPIVASNVVTFSLASIVLFFKIKNG